MKLKYIVATIVVVLLGIISFNNFISFNNNKLKATNQSNKPEIIIPIKRQPVVERKIKETKFRKIQTIDLESLKIYQPSNIKVVDSENIYLLDFSVPAVKKINIKNLDILNIGKGKGKGPGELINPTDYFIDDNQNIWIVDGGLNSILRFNSKNEFKHSVKIKHLIYRGVISSDGNLFLISSSGENLFLKYNYDSLINSFGQIISQQQKYAILLSGKVEIDKDNNLYFATDRSNLLISYTPNGKLRFATNTITGTDLLPKPKIMKSDLIVLPNTFTTLDIKSYNEYICLLNISGIKNETISYIDFYNSNTGLYSHSIRLPSKVISFAFYNDKLYLLEDFRIYSAKVD